jgi:molybdopterin biosynthesis enzyme
MNAVDGIAVFTVLDGQLVAEGTLVASVKTGPHLITAASLLRAEAIAARGSPARPVVEVRPYLPRRIAAVVKETLSESGRARFEETLRARVDGLRSTLVEVSYVADDADAVTAAFRRFARGPAPVDLLLTAGATSTDPLDAVFVGFAAIGGHVVSHGVPAHPGSMLWLGRAGTTTFLGLPTCGAYSKATAADILLPWLVAGDAADRRTVARLAHGGILTREMRFRFPPYARSFDAPDG